MSWLVDRQGVGFSEQGLMTKTSNSTDLTSIDESNVDQSSNINYHNAEITDETSSIVVPQSESNQCSINFNKKKQSDSNPTSDRESALQASLFGSSSASFFTNKLKEEKLVGNSFSKATNSFNEQEPVWRDEDDECLEANGVASGNQRLKEFERIFGPTPAWADVDSSRNRTRRALGALLSESSSSGEESDDERTPCSVLRPPGVRDLVASAPRSVVLPAGELDYRRCPHANRECPARGRLTNVEFHPTAPVLLASGANFTLNLFQIDGKQNPKMQSILVDRFPIHCAHFSASGDEVIIGSRYANLFVYDMIAGRLQEITRVNARTAGSGSARRGRALVATGSATTQRFEVSPDARFIVLLDADGRMHLLSAKSKEWIDTLAMNGSVESVAFSSDGTQLFSFGDAGRVHIWDVRARRCSHVFTDEGCVRGTAMAVGGSGGLIACGASSGVVNVYTASEALRAASPRPLHSMHNLLTPVTRLRFNATGELLAASSSHADRAIKLLHTGARSVMSNFPIASERALHRVSALDFSPHSGYLSLGTDTGAALLFRLKHYGSY